MHITLEDGHNFPDVDTPIPWQQGRQRLDFRQFAPNAAGEKIRLSRPDTLPSIRLFMDETQQQVYMHLCL